MSYYKLKTGPGYEVIKRIKLEEGFSSAEKDPVLAVQKKVYRRLFDITFKSMFICTLSIK